MHTTGFDSGFAGSIPDVYDELMVPLLFERYAEDLARRVAALAPARVLEVAAGTGAVTRALARALTDDVEIVATDVAPAMLERAARVGTRRPVRWQPADAAHLPAPDATVDVVVCQFGAMFFPAKVRAFAEARRVLRPRGTLLFSVWDRLEVNELSAVVAAALAALFPDDPPRFLERVPHGYADHDAIARDLAEAGFVQPPRVDTVEQRSCAPSARRAAEAICQGTPLRHEIEARGRVTLEEATDACADAIARRFGDGPLDAPMRALVVTAMR